MKERLYSVLRNLQLALLILIADVVLAGVAFLLTVRLLAFVFILIALVLPLLGPPFAILHGLLHPVSKDRKIRGRDWLLVGPGGGLGLLVCAASFYMLIVFSDCDRNIDETYACRFTMLFSRTYGDYPIGHMVPWSATDIHITGNTGTFLGLGCSCKITCKVSEEVFRNFARSWDYPLMTNAWCNVNPETREEFKGICADSVCPDGDGCHTNVLTCLYLYKTAGGIALSYDRDTKTLYGSFSAN